MPPVVLIMIDGLRPEAATPEHCPHLMQVMARGAFSLTARSVMPSITLPCHMSIFHSVPPARHGITSNDWAPLARPLPGLIEVAHAAGKKCAFFFNWEPLRDLCRPGHLLHAHFKDCAYDYDGDAWVVDEAARVIPHAALDFAFVYLGTVDTMGHLAGWLSADYLKQAKYVDEQLGRLLAALPADASLLILSDHGGHERNHGSDAPEDMTIVWTAAGPGIRRNHAIAGPVSLLETAPTLARLLGVTPHPHWEGRVVEEIFAPD